MDIRFTDEAENDIKQFEEEKQRYVVDRLSELKDNPVRHKDSGLIQVQGHQVFKYVMKENETRGGKDFRAIYDVKGDYVQVIAVFNRDQGYNKENLSRRV